MNLIVTGLLLVLLTIIVCACMDRISKQYLRIRSEIHHAFIALEDHLLEHAGFIACFRDNPTSGLAIMEFKDNCKSLNPFGWLTKYIDRKYIKLCDYRNTQIHRCESIRTDEHSCREYMFTTLTDMLEKGLVSRTEIRVLLDSYLLLESACHPVNGDVRYNLPTQFAVMLREKNVPLHIGDYRSNSYTLGDARRYIANIVNRSIDDGLF